MKVWVTRDEPDDGPLSTALRTRGLEVILEPVVQQRTVAEAADLLNELGSDDWLVLTSPYAIKAAACDAARVPRVAVVGESSRKLAEERGLRVDLVSPDGYGKRLFEELRARARGCKVCYLRSTLAKVPEAWPSVELRCPVLYETVSRDFDRGVIQRVDVAAVASPSAVRAIGPVDLPLASIGRTTSAAVRELGGEPWLEAATPNFESLAAAIAAQKGDSRHQRA